METVNIQSAVDRLKEMIQSKIANLHAESCGLSGGKGFLQIDFMQSAPDPKDGRVDIAYEIRQCGARLKSASFRDEIGNCPSTYGQIGIRLEETPSPGTFVPTVFLYHHAVGFASHEAEAMVMALTHNLSMPTVPLLWNRAAVDICARTCEIVGECMSAVSSTAFHQGVISPLI